MRIRMLVVAALAASSSLLMASDPGCSGKSKATEATIAFTWTVDGVAASTACPGSTAIVSILSPSLTPGVASSCSTGSAEAGKFKKGVYDFSLHYDSESGVSRSLSRSVTVDDSVLGDAMLIPVDFATTAGQAAVSWTINGGTPAQHCPGGGDTVSIVPRGFSSLGKTTDCLTGLVHLSELPVGPLTFDATLTAGGVAVVGTGAVTTVSGTEVPLTVDITCPFCN